MPDSWAGARASVVDHVVPSPPIPSGCADQAKRARSIDYNRTDEHAPGHFDQFYLEMLEDDNFIQCVPGFDDPLTAGAGTRRAKEFFRLLSLLFMHPDESDRIRILNCTAMNPDMPNLEDAGFCDDSWWGKQV